MSVLIIFGAKYLVYVSAAVAVIFLLRQSRVKQKEILIFAAIVLPLAYAVAKIAGYFYFSPRPFVSGNFVPLIPHSADNGFPSDHTLLVAALAAVIFRFGKKTGLLLFLLAVLTGAARVLSGVHHTTDIAGSIFTVLVVYIFAFHILQWLEKRKKQRL